MNTFHDDMKFGKYFERKCLENCLEYDYYEISPEGRVFSDWDIKIIKDSVTTTYEVKADRLVRRYGNFYIETQGKYGNKSGLSTTKADYYLLVKPSADLREIEEVYEISVEMLREMSVSGDYIYKTGGEGSYGFLLPERKLVQLST